MRELRVTLLGPFSMTDGVRGLPAQVLRKAQDLLALILISPGRRVQREAAAEALWPDAPAESSKKAIRQALWQIHRATDNGMRSDRRLVLSDGEALHINSKRRLWVDVPVFSEAVRIAQNAEAGALEADELAGLSQAADLYRGPLHAGCYDEWCLIPRARLEDRCLTLLDTLSREHEGRSELGPAISWAQRLLDIEPAHEGTHRRLMRMYFDSGDRTRALRQFHRCRWVLEHELGVAPDASTEEVGAAIGSHRVPPVRASAPAPAALDGIRTELLALRRSIDAIGERLRDVPV